MKTASIAFAALLLLAGTPGLAAADGGTVARNTDDVARERQKEYEELQKKETFDAPGKRLKILEGLAFASCNTAKRFLLSVVKKPTAPGDERLVALRSLLVMVEESALEQVLATLAREKDPVLWQVFGEALAVRPSPAVEAWIAGPGLSAPPTEAVAACLEGLSRRPVPATAKRVADLYAKHAKPAGDGDLACRALRAMIRADAAAVGATLREAARNPDARLRLVAAELLPATEPFAPEVEAAVRGLLQDESETVRQVAAAGIGTARRVNLAPSLVALLADPRARTRHVAATALEQATGKLGHDPKAWAAWLEKKDPGTPEGLTVPTYHGVALHSDRVVFLVDASSSMAWPQRKPVHRIDVARAELAAVLGKLSPDTLFNVVVYSDKFLSWKKEEVPATPENVAAAGAWSEKALAAPAGETHLFEALDAAFASDPRFDTIFLLTDGNPTAGKYWSTDGLLAAVRGWTRHRRTAIHCIGLSLASEDIGAPNLTEDLGVMKALLGAIAGATGGEFREVLEAPKK